METTPPGRGASARHESQHEFIRGSPQRDTFINLARTNSGTTSGGKLTTAPTLMNETLPSRESETQSEPDAGTRAASFEQFAVAIRSIQETQARFAKTREQVILLRNQLAWERQNFYQKQEYVLDSMKKAMDEFQKLKDGIGTSERLAHVLGLMKPMEEDRRRLMEQGAKVEALENVVSSLEVEMRREEGQLAHVAVRAIQSLDALGMGLSMEARVAARLDVSHYLDARELENNDINPLLLDYYDKLGEVKIMNERLVDFEANYDVGKAQKQLIEDQGIHSEETMAAFEERWNKDRAPYRGTLERTIAAADLARAACFAAGLDPDSYKKLDSDKKSHSSDTSNDDQAAFHAPPTDLYLDTATTAAQMNPGQYDRPRERDKADLVRAYQYHGDLNDPAEEHFPRPVEHITAGSGEDTSAQADEESNERVVMWMQDVEERTTPPEPTQDWYQSPLPAAQKRRRKAESLRTYSPPEAEAQSDLVMRDYMHDENKERLRRAASQRHRSTELEQSPALRENSSDSDLHQRTKQNHNPPSRDTLRNLAPIYVH